MVAIPDFAYSLGFYLPGNYSLFRILITLGVATNMTLNNNKNGYEPAHPKLNLGKHQTATPWYSVQASVPARQRLLNIFNQDIPLTDDNMLMLSIAIEFGTLDALGNPTALKYGGAGKILLSR